jgi:hypothetical protein
VKPWPWKRPGWKYVAPVFIAPPNWDPAARRVLVDANLILNALLPVWLLRRLDARTGAKTYWRAIRRREAREWEDFRE